MLTIRDHETTIVRDRDTWPILSPPVDGGPALDVLGSTGWQYI